MAPARRRDRRRSADRPVQPERDPGVARHDLRPARRRGDDGRDDRLARAIAGSGSSRRSSTPSTVYTDADLRGPLAIVLGSEADGLTAAWRGRDVEPVAIPMRGIADSLNVSIAAAIVALRGASASATDRPTRGRLTPMETFDFVIIGAGPGRRGRGLRGPRARRLGRDRRPPLVRRQLPAHRLPAIEVAAPRRRRARGQPGDATPGRGPRRARDYMVNRPPTPPSPTTRRTSGASRTPARSCYRGSAPDRRPRPRRDPPRRRDPRDRGRERRGRGRLGLEGPAPRRASTSVRIWTNREATLARELPRSLLVLGGGPTGCELAQVYARFGVPVTIVQSGDRLMPTEHPRNSEVGRGAALARDGVDVRLGVRATARARRRRHGRRAT